MTYRRQLLRERATRDKEEWMEEEPDYVSDFLAGAGTEATGKI